MSRIILFMLLLAFTCLEAKIINHIVARVNKIPVTFYDVIVRYEFSLIREGRVSAPKLTSENVLRYLRMIIIEELILQEAEKFDFKPLLPDDRKKAVDEIRKKIKKKKKLKSRFDKFMNKYDLGNDDLESIIDREYRYEKFIEYKIKLSAISVSEDEVKKFFEANRKRFAGQKFRAVSNNIRNYLKRLRVNNDLTDWINRLKEKNLVEIYRE